MYPISDKENAIRTVQRYLLELHYGTEGLPLVTIDGIFDESTKSAVKQYQALRALPPTGEVDFETFRTLYRDYQHALQGRMGLQKIPPDSRLPLSAGAHGEGVAEVQRLLNALASRYRLGVRTDVTGVYSYATAAVANAIRRIYALPEDGSVSGEMFSKMLRDYGYPQSPEIAE